MKAYANKKINLQTICVTNRYIQDKIVVVYLH